MEPNAKKKGGMFVRQRNNTNIKKKKKLKRDKGGESVSKGHIYFDVWIYVTNPSLLSDMQNGSLAKSVEVNRRNLPVMLIPPGFFSVKWWSFR